MDIISLTLAKNYTDSVALSGVPVKTPQIDANSKHWLVFNPTTNSFVDTGIVAEGRDGVTPTIGANANWWIGGVDTGKRAVAREVEIDAVSGFIKWRYIGDPNWIDMIALSTLAGKDGETPEFRSSGNYFQIRYPVSAPDWTTIYTFPDINGKLDKVTAESLLYRVYAIQPNGNQTVLDVVTSPVEMSIPVYTSKKTLKTADPEANDDAANKHYVDEEIKKVSGTGDGGGGNIYIEETDPIYTADKPNIALKSELTAHKEDQTAHSDLRQMVNDLEFVKDASYNETTGDVLLTFRDNTILSFNIFVENFAKDIRYDPSTKELVITKKDGTEIRVSIADLVDVYVGSDGDEIQITIGGRNEIKAVLKLGTVTKQHLEQSVRESLDLADTALQSFIEADPVYTQDKPFIALKTEVEAVETTVAALDDVLNTTNTEVAKIGDDLSTLTNTVEEITDTLTEVDTQIEALWQAENTLESKHNALESKHNTLDDKVTDNIINTVEYSNANNTLVIESTAKVLSTIFGLASSIQNGIMPKEAFGILEQLVQDVASLKSVTFVPLGTISVDSTAFETLSDADRTSMVLTELGLTEININDGIKTSDHITWVFNEGGHWVRWGDTVIQVATATSPGIVLSAEDIQDNIGKIFVELNGIQSVIGWDWLVDLVNSKAPDTQSIISIVESTAKFTPNTSNSVGLFIQNFVAKINGIITALGNKYEKPSTGIPKTDLASAVQTSLDKADSALQNMDGAVLTTGAQTISGNKTFSGTTTIGAITMNGNMTLNANRTIAAGSYTLALTGNITVPDQTIP